MILKNTALVGFGIGHFINATTGAAVTTGTPTCKRTLDGTGGACANAASYNTDGAVWEIDLAAADLNGDMVILSFTLTDCLPISYTIRTVDALQTGDSYAVVTNATYGLDKLARTGADSDTLETLSDQLDGVYTGTPPEASAIADAVWDEATSGHVAAGTYGKAVGDGVTAWVTAAGFSTHSAADVWAVATREVTGGTIDTCTTNTDMRGTDNAALAANWTETRAGYIDKLNVTGTLAHSDAAATYKATGFSTHSADDVVTALGTGSTLTDCATATGFSTHSAADVVTALGTGSTLTDCLTATGFSTLDAAGVRTAVGLAAANLDTQLADIPTVAEFNARTLVASAYFDPAADTVANVTTVATVTNAVTTDAASRTASKADVSGLSTFDASSDKVYLGNGAHGGAAATITLGDYSDFQGAGGADAATIYTYFTDESREEAFHADVSGLATSAALATVDDNVDAILSDTNTLQTEWADGGRLDLILDGRASADSLNTVGNNVSDILTDTNTLQTEWADGGRLDLILDTVADDVAGLDGAAMRGTDNAALAATALSTTVWTNAKAGYLDENVSAAKTLTVAERTSIGTAVWASTTRTLTSFGTLVADTVTAMQAAGTYLARLFGLIENSDGDRFTAKALEQAAASSAPTADAIADEVYDSGRVFPAANLANAPTGATTSITVLPYTGTAAGTGELSNHALTAYQHAAATFALGVYDSAGEAVDLTGRDLAWVAFDPNKPAVAVLVLKNYDDETAIAISGESDNTALVSLSPADTALAKNLSWILRDVTNDLALMVGTLRIVHAPAVPVAEEE
jgi:hypothetical protein